MRGRAKRHTRIDDAKDEYAGAFARVRLVRAWIAAASAMVGVLAGWLALVERLVKR
ncbi:MAG TPA: hypothetical protein VFP90_04905 [Gemmatimonadaceae bacterium]|nr:hypothetical protein [Gemmatimonadaceae bacterium]